MERFEIIVSDTDEGGRIDAMLAEHIEEVTRSFVQRRMDEGGVTVNGTVHMLKRYKVRAGDVISLEMPEPQMIEAQPEEILLDIVYEDEDVVVVNKPRGMVVHPAAGNESGTLVNGLLYHCRNLSGINGKIRPGIVHRIDKDTTGLLVAAKNDFAHAGLAQQMQEHSVMRIYDAIVHGVIREDEGTVNAPIGRHPADRLKMAVVRSGGREAITHYKVLTRFDRFTHLQARLETGRTHQIRVHMAYIHHPLAGDFVYGPSKKVHGMDTQLLHAGVLGFIHPRTGEYLEFRADLPETFAGVLGKLAKRI